MNMSAPSASAGALAGPGVLASGAVDHDVDIRELVLIRPCRIEHSDVVARSDRPDDRLGVDM
jgi:hypothetical protein